MLGGSNSVGGILKLVGKGIVLMIEGNREYIIKEKEISKGLIEA